VAAVLAGSLVLAACGGDGGDEKGQSGTRRAEEATGKGPESSKPAPAAVTVLIRKSIDSFDPHRTLGEDGAQQFMLFLYDTMVRRTLDGGIEPGVATSWKLLPEGQAPTSAVFTIREGLKCADGTPLGATEVARSFERYAREGSGAAQVFGPAGAKSVTADPAANTVTFELNGPNNDILTGLAFNGEIVCPAGLDDPDAMQSTAPSGSGPYILRPGFKKDDEYVLQRRDDYTALPEGTKLTDLPKVVTLKLVTEDTTAADLVEKNSNTIASILSTDAERLMEDDGLVSVPAAAYGTNALTFNQRKGEPFSDPELRRGVAALIDSVQGGNAETQRLGKPIRTLYTENIDCYLADDSDALPAYDPEAAAKALDEAGYRKGGDGFRTKPDGSPLKVRIVGDHTQFKAPEYMAQALREGGFDVDLKVGVRSESYARFFVGDYDLGSYPFIAQIPLPSLYYNQVAGSGPLDNLPKIDNPRYAELAAKAWAAAPDSKERCDLWQQAERALLEQADTVPMDQPVKYWFGNGLTFDAAYFKIDPFTIRTA
jgi:peptide/nickel transport system substrate-binding protein